MSSIAPGQHVAQALDAAIKAANNKLTLSLANRTKLVGQLADAELLVAEHIQAVNELCAARELYPMADTPAVCPETPGELADAAARAAAEAADIAEANAHEANGGGA